MKILSIGNSFSQDAQRYLHSIAKSDNTDIYCVNLMIGGCSLERHAANIANNSAEYGYEINGESAKEKVSIADALVREKWDIITVQQVSFLAGKYETFEPDLSTVVDTVRTAIPDAKIYFHETWAYETDSTHFGFIKYDGNQLKMYDAIHMSAAKAADKIHAGIIPTGTVIQQIRHDVPAFLYQSGGRSLNRDGYHLSLGYGRYAAALIWYSTLTGRKVENIDSLPECDNEPMDPIIAKNIRQTIDKAMIDWKSKQK